VSRVSTGFTDHTNPGPTSIVANYGEVSRNEFRSLLSTMVVVVLAPLVVLAPGSLAALVHFYM
jgi:hypothetical protein